MYVDDVIFGATNETLCREFSKLMMSEFEMSMMGELNFFLGLQIKQSQTGTRIHQKKYLRELLKRYGMDLAKPIDTSIPTATRLGSDEGGKSVDEKTY